MASLKKDKIKPQDLASIKFPLDLPVSKKVESIKKIVNSNQVTIICGETGSGKTTQLPKICLTLGRGQNKLIGHTQPRRIAARSVALRIAEELNVEVGGLVGFKVRFANKVSKLTAIKVMTDGILLAETQNDQLLQQYDTLIIDEAHERSLNIDFLLGYIKKLLPRRPDLKVIITSATIDVDKFSSHFHNAPIIQVSGRTYPVDILYRPLLQQNDDTTQGLDDAILSVINEFENQKGDILIFLPGERDIHDIKRFLVDQLKNQYEVLPLFSRLAIKEQQKIFKQNTIRRIILSTNIAETSITVPGVKFVIDAGVARIVRYNPRLKIEQLLIEKISQASANQRAGRCGRISHGICIRLYDEDEFKARSEFTDPEIMRTSLASVILKMASLNLGSVDQFPFLQPPIKKFVQDGYHLLYEIGAVDKENKILSIGQKLAQLPIDPSLGRMLLEAKIQNCLSEILVIISALSISDPKNRPLDKTEKADLAHLKFHHTESGFLSFLKLWNLLHKELKGNTSKGLRVFCQKYFLSFTRMREWQELHKQLMQMANELEFNISKKEATYEQIHIAILSGLLGNIGVKSLDSFEYQGTRGIKFLIGPKLYRNKNYKWIMAAEIIDTGRLYAQCISKINIEWVEKLSLHLANYEYSNPRWNKKLSRVDVTQKTLLYGLIINPSKTINYGNINVAESRKIFIRRGLVEMEYETNASFWKHNLSLIDEIEKLEHKSRRQDILINQDLLYEFYDNKIDKAIVNGAGFEFWRKSIEEQDPNYLFLSKAYLMQKSADQIDEIQYPDNLQINDTSVALKYHFEPKHPKDGLSVIFSYSELNQINSESFDWLVPGMIREKVSALIKGLPKAIRTQLVPIPNLVTEFLSESDNKSGFNQLFTKFIRKKTRTNFLMEDQLINSLPSHLKVNFTLVDERGFEIDTSKCLFDLQQAHKEKVTEVIDEISFEITKEGLTLWPSFDIPETVNGLWQGENIIGYPALVSRESSVDIIVKENIDEAKAFHYEGVKKLLQLQIKDRIKVLKNNPLKFDLYALPLKTYIDSEILKQNCFDIVIDESMNWGAPMPRSQKDFDALIIFIKKKIGQVSLNFPDTLVEIAKFYQVILTLLQKTKSLPTYLKEDIDEQLEILLPPYEKPLFLYENFKHYPRFLLALKIRIEKYNQRQAKDQESYGEIDRIQIKWIEKVTNFVEKGLEIPKDFIDFHWSLQELRVSLFSQELKTLYPVSVKRLDRQWADLINQ